MGEGERRVTLQAYGPLGLNLKEKIKHKCLVVVVDSFYRSDAGVPYCAEASRRIYRGDIILRVDGRLHINSSVAAVNDDIRQTVRDHKIGITVLHKSEFTKALAKEYLENSTPRPPVARANPLPTRAAPAPAPRIPARPAPAPKPAALRSAAVSTKPKRRGPPPGIPVRAELRTQDTSANDELERARRDAEESRRQAAAAQAELEALRAQLAANVNISGVAAASSGQSGTGRRRRRSSIQKAAQASAQRRSAERVRAAPVPAPRRVSKPTGTAHEASGTIISKYHITDLATVQQIMFAASKKLRIAVLDAKGKALGMEIEKVKTKNKKGKAVKRILITGFYRDGSRICVAESSGQIEPDDEIREINGKEITSHTQAVSILKDLNSTGQVIVLAIKRRKSPGPSRLSNKRLSVGRPTY
eukprot:INCI8286.1.p1 GENE.INCI8286.1~~INCI8286.1.p1  ORF type:complete len:417 (-),score=63.45 INCI8286.1:1486-2736(-)